MNWLRCFCIIQLLLGTSILNGQTSHSIELKGIVGDSIRKICSRYIALSDTSIRTIPYIYIIDNRENKNVLEVYFGKIPYVFQLPIMTPSYYFSSFNKIPVFVFTGLETMISFDDSYKSEIISLGKQYLEGDEIVFTYHYRMWYCKFKGNRMIKFSKRLSKKRNRKGEAFERQLYKSKSGL